jgi:hypothetical protein
MKTEHGDEKGDVPAPFWGKLALGLFPILIVSGLILLEWWLKD